MKWMREQIGRENETIRKTYRFSTFMEAIAFVNEAARLAEQYNHHPHIAIDYRDVTLGLTTWSAGGLTELDFALALEFDRLYEEQ